ncbi:receptor-like protein EIX2 [Silene latifolia]|uniref:receptor-like protein EIX2 n=1 Tax=Silene latifolia TaxID=37657 RepID=UPI003D774B38
MSYNKIYGVLPNWLNISIFEIDLSSNLFEGVVPSGVANPGNLFLNDNRFSNCSFFLCQKIKNSLGKLALSNNLLSGELPDCWMHFSYLSSLNLENNEFSGRIPNSIGTLLNLQYLDLHYNSFSGPLPTAFMSCTSLVILNLGYNLFSGNITPLIGNAFQDIRVLILRKNHFTREIPESICKLNKLQILDLAINHLSGVISNCFGNFTAMEGIKNNLALDFRPGAISLYNDLYFGSGGEIGGNPKRNINSEWIRSTRLVKNKLSGNISFEIGNLTALELLDLSNNHLTGEIPASLANVTTLGIVNVSNNNLSGEILVSTQLQSFDAPSYAGNPRLCGAPFPICSKDRVLANVPSGYNTSVQNKDDDFVFFLGLYISVVLGFIVGFWGVCGTLIIKTSWRHAYFRLIDNIKDRIM